MSVRTRILWSALFSVSLFLAALWLIQRSLAHVRIDEVANAVMATSPVGIGVALLLTVAAYAVLTGYDVLALRFVSHPLPYPRTALASFLGFAIGNSVGLALLTGGTVRYRIYSAAGLSPLEIASVVGFCGFTFGLGTVVIVGVTLLAQPGAAADALHVAPEIARGLALLLLFAAAGYLGWTAIRRAPVRLGRRILRVPGPLTTVSQIVLAGLDLSLAAGVLYVLLPAGTGVGFGGFLAVYVLAMVAGIASHVPGGIGVFESILLLGLPQIPAPLLLGAALAYRGIYYLAPLAVATTLLGVHELLLHGHRFARLIAPVADIVARLTPQIGAALTLVCGTLLLVSAAAPQIGTHHLSAATGRLPALFTEFTYLGASLVGLAMLLGARGVYRRLGSAWALCVTLSFAGAALSLIGGSSDATVAILAVVGLVLLGQRRAFYRSDSLLVQRFPAGWMIIVILVLSATAWLGALSATGPWHLSALWSGATAGGAGTGRYLRSSVLVTLAAGAFFLRQLFLPLPRLARAPVQEDRARMQAIVERSAHAADWGTLEGEHPTLFSKPRDAFLRYTPLGENWVSLRGAIGAQSAVTELLWAFREYCDAWRTRPVLFDVDVAYLPLYLDLGLSPLKIGEQALVPLARFDARSSPAPDLVDAHGTLARTGVDFAVLGDDEAEQASPRLVEIEHSWRTAHPGPVRALGLRSDGRSAFGDTAVLRRGEEILAFARLLRAAGRRELMLEGMRWMDHAEAGTMEFLLIETMAWGRANGFRYFNLGMGPLGSVAQRALTLTWHHLGVFVYHHGEHFRYFDALRRYQEKFNPEWRACYLAAPGGSELDSVLEELLVVLRGEAPR